MNYIDFYKILNNTSLNSYINEFEKKIEQNLCSKRHPQIIEWNNLLDKVPTPSPEQINLKSGVIAEGDFIINLEEDLKKFSPWRKGPFVLYGRGQYEIVSGNSPNQETPAIVDIPNYYLMGAITPGREYMAPRGFSGRPRFGNRAFMGTIELRTPILPVDFLELLNIIKLGSPTFALVSDFGDAWDSKLNIKNQ